MDLGCDLTHSRSITRVTGDQGEGCLEACQLQDAKESYSRPSQLMRPQADLSSPATIQGIIERLDSGANGSYQYHIVSSLLFITVCIFIHNVSRRTRDRLFQDLPLGRYSRVEVISLIVWSKFCYRLPTRHSSRGKRIDVTIRNPSQYPSNVFV